MKIKSIEYDDKDITLKPFTYHSDSTWNYGKKGKAVIIIDHEHKTIDVDIIGGLDPMAWDVLLLLLSDKDVRMLIREYQQDGHRDLPFALRVSCGSSGRSDIYINSYTKYGLQISGKKLLHISGYGKLNEGFQKMWVGDFVELMVFMIKLNKEDFPLGDLKALRRMSGCKYVNGYFSDNTLSTNSKLL